MIIEIKHLDSWTKNSVTIGDRFIIENKEHTINFISQQNIRMDSGYIYPKKMFNRWIRLEKAYVKREVERKYPDLIVTIEDPVSQHVEIRNCKGHPVTHLKSFNVRTGQFERYATSKGKVIKPYQMQSNTLFKGYQVIDRRTNMPFNRMKLYAELQAGRNQPIQELETETEINTSSGKTHALSPVHAPLESSRKPV